MKDVQSTQMPCPQCGALLAIRTNTKTKRDFLGCTRYPECRYSEPLPASVEMERLGAQHLPGL